MTPVNASKTGLGLSGSADTRKTMAGTTDPVYSGPTGVDQSISLGSVPAPATTNPGNRLTNMPPIKHGN